MSPVMRPFRSNTSPSALQLSSDVGADVVRCFQNVMRRSISDVSTAPKPEISVWGLVRSAALLTASAGAPAAAGVDAAWLELNSWKAMTAAIASRGGTKYTARPSRPRRWRPGDRLSAVPGVPSRVWDALNGSPARDTASAG